MLRRRSTDEIGSRRDYFFDVAVKKLTFEISLFWKHSKVSLLLLLIQKQKNESFVKEKKLFLGVLILAETFVAGKLSIGRARKG